MATNAEKPKTRSELVRRARMGPFSIWTALVGTLIGGITLAVLVAGTHTVLQQNESNIDLSKAWDELGRRGLLVFAGLLFVSHVVAAFVGGRMAWRRGWLHGLAAEIDLRERVDRSAASDERLAPVNNGQNGQPKQSEKDIDADIDSLAKDELYELAQEFDITGRSQMTKEELVRAVRKEMRALSKG